MWPTTSFWAQPAQEVQKRKRWAFQTNPLDPNHTTIFFLCHCATLIMMDETWKLYTNLDVYNSGQGPESDYQIYQEMSGVVCILWDGLFIRPKDHSTTVHHGKARLSQRGLDQDNVGDYPSAPINTQTKTTCNTNFRPFSNELWSWHRFAVYTTRKMTESIQRAQCQYYPRNHKSKVVAI